MPQPIGLFDTDHCADGPIEDLNKKKVYQRVLNKEAPKQPAGKRVGKANQPKDIDSANLKEGGQ